MRGSALIPLGLLVLFGLVAAITKPSRAKLLANELVTRNLLSDYWRPAVERAAARLTVGSVLRDKWQINGEVRDEFLNIYILVPGIEREETAGEGVRGLAGNCAYLGSDNIIVLDTWYLNRFLTKRKLGSRIDLTNSGGMSRYQADAANLTLWVLGHEIGHIVSGHGAAHWSTNGLEQVVNSASFRHAREFEADRWLASYFRGRPQHELDDHLATLVDILQAEIAFKRLGHYPDPFDDSIRSPLISYDGEVAYGEVGTHPEYVVRIARLMELMSDIPNPAHELLQANVREFISRLKKESK